MVYLVGGNGRKPGTFSDIINARRYKFWTYLGKLKQNQEYAYDNSNVRECRDN
jgi:hypothetical protein